MSDLVVANHGPLITATNYWETEAARAGKVLVSLNAGAFRVLLPRGAEGHLADMRTARECVVSRGPWPAQRLPDAFEILYDDGTDSPFALHLAPESFDRAPLPEDQGKEWVLTVWTRQRGDRPHQALQRPCWYRIVPRIPYLKPREF